MSNPLVTVTVYTTSREYPAKDGGTFWKTYADLQRGRSVKLISDGRIVSPEETPAMLVAVVADAVTGARADSVEAVKDLVTSKVATALNSDLDSPLTYDVMVRVDGGREFPIPSSAK